MASTSVKKQMQTEQCGSCGMQDLKNKYYIYYCCGCSCVGIPIASLGVAIGCTGLAGHRTGTNEPFGRGPVPGDPGRITEGTNELFGEDLAVINRLVLV